MNLELIFSAMTGLAVLGWLCLILAPLRREPLVAAARVVAALLSLAYALLILRGLTQPGNPTDGNFSSLAGVMSLLSVPAVMLPAWIHYLAFDLWVGTWEVEDAPRSGVPHWLVIPCMVLTFMLGPVGLLAYLVIRTVAKRMRRPAAA